jgi:hypothetical protein
MLSIGPKPTLMVVGKPCAMITRTQSAKLADGRPRVALTMSYIRRSDAVKLTPHADPPQDEMAPGSKYLNSVEVAGGMPVAVPSLSEGCVGPLLDWLAGMCLSGGPDLDWHRPR